MALVATPTNSQTTHRDGVRAAGQVYCTTLAVNGAAEIDGALTLNTSMALGAGAASTGRITTTDGVSGGTAKVVGGLAYSQTAAGTALTNSTTETVLGSYSIPASTIKLGTVMRVRYQVIASTTTGATTLIVRLRLGPTTLTGTALITHSTVDAADSNIVTGYAELIARAAPGATAACVAVTQYSQLAAAGGAVLGGFMASTNFATNGILLLEVTGIWSAADANSCRCDILDVWID